MSSKLRHRYQAVPLPGNYLSGPERDQEEEKAIAALQRAKDELARCTAILQEARNIYQPSGRIAEESYYKDLPLYFKHSRLEEKYLGIARTYGRKIGGLKNYIEECREEIERTAQVQMIACRNAAVYALLLPMLSSPASESEWLAVRQFLRMMFLITVRLSHPYSVTARWDARCYTWLMLGEIAPSAYSDPPVWAVCGSVGAALGLAAADDTAASKTRLFRTIGEHACAGLFAVDVAPRALHGDYRTFRDDGGIVVVDRAWGILPLRGAPEPAGVQLVHVVIRAARLVGLGAAVEPAHASELKITQTEACNVFPLRVAPEETDADLLRRVARFIDSRDTVTLGTFVDGEFVEYSDPDLTSYGLLGQAPAGSPPADCPLAPEDYPAPEETTEPVDCRTAMDPALLISRLLAVRATPEWNAGEWPFTSPRSASPYARSPRSP